MSIDTNERHCHQLTYVHNKKFNFAANEHINGILQLFLLKKNHIYSTFIAIGTHYIIK